MFVVGVKQGTKGGHDDGGSDEDEEGQSGTDSDSFNFSIFFDFLRKGNTKGARDLIEKYTKSPNANTDTQKLCGEWITYIDGYKGPKDGYIKYAYEFVKKYEPRFKVGFKGTIFSFHNVILKLTSN